MQASFSLTIMGFRIKFACSKKFTLSIWQKEKVSIVHGLARNVRKAVTLLITTKGGMKKLQKN
jgi:hypothetical protein